MQDTQFPDRDTAHLVVELLLDPVQQRFPLLAVTLLGLLGVPGVDLRVLHPRQRSLTLHKGIKARSSAAKGATGLQREGLVGLLAMSSLVGSALHGPHVGPNAHRRQV